MSNAVVVPGSFSGPVAAIFQGQQAQDDLSGGVGGGYGLLKYRGKVWSIQHNNQNMNLMRDDGDGPRGSVDVIIVKANPQLSKTFYENGWDENNNNPPDCASANGITPDQGVPKKQADVCAMCPKNAWGSAPNGGKGKACGDHRRMAIVPLADPRNETFGGPLLLRCPAASLQDLAAFEGRFRQMGYPYFTMAIKISFDPAESFPKFVFAAIRPLTEQEGAVVLELRDSPHVARVISDSVPVTAAPAVGPQPGAFLEAPPANAIQPQQVSPQPRPVQQPAPAPTAQPGPVVQPVVGTGFGPADGAHATTGPQPVPAAVQHAPAPAPVQAPAQATGGGGFGPAASQPAAAPAAGPAPVAQPAPAPAPQATVAAPQAARPAPQMTGFGGVTPEVAPAPTQAPAGPAPAMTQANAPGVVSALEGSIDERLASLLGS